MYTINNLETSKEEYETLKKNWKNHSEMQKLKKENERIKEKIAMIKKKEVVVIRNDQLLIEAEDENAGDSPKLEKFGIVRSFLMGPIGILIWTMAIIFGIYFVLTQVFLLWKPHSQVEFKK
jgi:hypothetical protein